MPKSQRWPFGALMAVGLLMVAMACISSVAFASFPIFQALVGAVLTGIGVIGWRKLSLNGTARRRDSGQ